MDEAPEMRAILGALRRGTAEPRQAPREEMWAEITARIRSEGIGPAMVADSVPATHPEETPVVPLGPRRVAYRRARWLRLAAAASVVLLVGIALGRSTAPVGTAPEALGPTAAGLADGAAGAPGRGLDPALRGHLGRSESLLAVVRSDGRQGRIDPTASTWARGLLTQTRLLLDARAGGDPALVALLQDLELVLAEIVMAAESGPLDGPRARAELDLLLAGLEAGGILSRLSAACPNGCVRPEV
jgi:hypothetical protein